MKKIEDFLEHNKQWAQKKLNLDRGYFEKLSKGQTPIALYIGCSDSRVPAEVMMRAIPGDLFVHRNVANLVVNTDNNMNAVVQFAIEYLKVKHIIVCGHYGCGGVKAAMNPKDMGQLNSWLQNLRDVYRFHQDVLDAIENPKERYDKLVELNVQEQCINIIKIDHVQRALYATGYPKIYGWVFDIKTGLLVDLKLNFSEILKDIRKIYDLSLD